VGREDRIRVACRHRIHLGYYSGPGSPEAGLSRGGQEGARRFSFPGGGVSSGAGSRFARSSQRYAGDAALNGSAELQVPVASFPLILPLNVGVFGFADAGRCTSRGSLPVAGTHRGPAWVLARDPRFRDRDQRGDRGGQGLTGAQLRTGLIF
jgi:hypothetical protein